jgi:transposase InsO family protein
LFGITRQAFYKHVRKQQKVSFESHIVLELIGRIRKQHPRMGVRKIYHLIKDDLDSLQIKIGRDALFDLMASEHLLIRKSRRTPITTNSNHWYKRYPNLIKGYTPHGPNQVWVSDITYIRTAQGFLYLFLITDAYSKKIMGFNLSRSLDSSNAVNCLQDALEKNSKPISGLIHHSDRGIQYCSKEYVNLLQENSIMISMTENGDPRENPIAERVNGILKHEYLFNELRKSKTLSINELNETIMKYNNQRPHLSCNMLTPTQAHNRSGKLERKWKTYYRKTVNFNQ